MLKLKKIAVTGSVATGKSSVCGIMQDLGAYVLSADELCHHLLACDKSCIQQVEALFGQEVIADHHLDRKKIADRAFSDPKLLLQLEKILHPLVLKKIQHLYEEACNLKKIKLFVVEVPLLFEAGWESFFDQVILVTAKEPLCLERYQTKNLKSGDFFLRKQGFLPEENIKHRADFVIKNEGTLQELKKQVTAVIQTLTNLS